MDTHITTDGTQELKDLYNLVMADIEPELMWENLPKNAEKYAHETDEEKKARVQHYANVLEQCFAVMDLVLTLHGDDVHRFKEAIMTQLKDKAGKEDSVKMADIEHSLDDA